MAKVGKPKFFFRGRTVFRLPKSIVPTVVASGVKSYKPRKIGG